MISLYYYYLLLHLLVLRISHTELLLAQILEGFTNNIKLNNPKFLVRHIFSPTLRYGAISAPLHTIQISSICI
jgi:hypothetical protein